MNFEAIIASAVVAAIVSGIFSMLEYQKANSLKYITEERSLWRKEMRGIIKEITIANAPEDIKAPLAELKARIDPRGLNWSGSIYDDHHIWEIIELLEEPDNDKFSDDKQLLISFLYLLLKQDWRRSNHEVRFSKSSIKGKVLFFVSIVLYISMYIGSCVYMYMDHRDISKNTLPVLDINKILLKLLISPEFMFVATSFILIWSVPSIAKWVLIRWQRHSNDELTNYEMNVCIYLIYGILQVINLHDVSIFFATGLAELQLAKLMVTPIETYKVVIPLAFMVISSHVRLKDMKTKFNFVKAYYFSINLLNNNEEFEVYHFPQRKWDKLHDSK